MHSHCCLVLQAMKPHVSRSYVRLPLMISSSPSPNLRLFKLLSSLILLSFSNTSSSRSAAAVMADRQVTQQTVLSHIAKLDDPDADLRYMSLNDLYTILTGPSSSFLSGDNRCLNKLAEGLLKALDDQHGDVQNQALKWYATITPLQHSRID